MHDRFRIGVITSTHGLKGEVKVFPTTDDSDRFKLLEYVIIYSGDCERKLMIRSVRFFKKFVILAFEGLYDISDVESMKGAELFIPREMAIPLGEDEYYIPDLLGMEVFDEEGSFVGHIDDVLTTGANDVYVISRKEAPDVLLPAIHECVLDVDTKGRRMTVHILEGLM